MFLLRNKFDIIVIFLWIFGIYLIFKKFHSTSNNDKVFEDRIEYLENEIKSLKQKLSQLTLENEKIQCEEFDNELKDVKRQLALKSENTTTNTTFQNEPTLEYELLRRKIENHARELFYFMNDQMNKILDNLSDDDKQQWKYVILRYSDQNRFILALIRNLTEVDGYQSWRQIEHENLSKLIQTRLNVLENPSEPCENLPHILYDINQYCGFGCQIHRTMRSLIVAYALGRTMILVSDEWSYNPEGFEQIFQPLSEVCNQSSMTIGTTWDRLVEISLFNNSNPRKDFMPMSIPEDLSERLIRLHGHPFVWFMGQFIKYLLRPQPWLNQFLHNKYKTILFQTPIVGIHIRRTDKETEAAFHDISEYMKYVEDYYIIYQYQNPNENFTKRIYLATDEPEVFQDARIKYPDYQWYGDINVAQSAQFDSRYTRESLKGLLLDIHFLSLCDYLVCTFSSQICRVAYEIMQQRIIDGAWRVQSLDDVYFFESQNGHYQRAIISHQPISTDEFYFQRGDIIATEGNHWNGFSKGSHLTNKQSGLYPSYKTEEIIKIGKMYTYPQIQIQID